MNLRQHLNEHLKKSRWAFVWRMAGLYSLLMTAFGLFGVWFAYMRGDPAAWSWMHMYPFTTIAAIRLVVLNTISGLLFGWFISYQQRPRSTSAV